MNNKKRFYLIDSTLALSSAVCTTLASLFFLLIHINEPFNPPVFLGVSFLFLCVSLLFWTTVKIVSISSSDIEVTGDKVSKDSVSYFSIGKFLYETSNLDKSVKISTCKYVLHGLTSDNKVQEFEIFSSKNLSRVLQVAIACMENSRAKIYVIHKQFKMCYTYEELISTWSDKIASDQCLILDEADDSNRAEYLFTTNTDNIGKDKICTNRNNIYLKKVDDEKKIFFYRHNFIFEKMEFVYPLCAYSFSGMLGISFIVRSPSPILLFLAVVVPTILYIVKKGDLSKWHEISFKSNIIKITGYERISADDIFYIYTSANDETCLELYLKDGSVLKLRTYAEVQSLFCELNKHLVTMR